MWVLYKVSNPKQNLNGRLSKNLTLELTLEFWNDKVTGSVGLLNTRNNSDFLFNTPGKVAGTNQIYLIRKI